MVLWSKACISGACDSYGEGRAARVDHGFCGHFGDDGARVAAVAVANNCGVDDAAGMDEIRDTQDGSPEGFVRIVDAGGHSYVANSFHSTSNILRYCPNKLSPLDSKSTRERLHDNGDEGGTSWRRYSIRSKSE